MKNQVQQQLSNAGFGTLSPDDFNAEYQRLIAADISDAQNHLDELPESQRRGLTLETLRHFHCGYLKSWVLTKSRAEFTCGTYTKGLTGEPKRLPPPSERIIIPTESMNHFNAVATPRARRNLKNDYWKQHAGEKELFCDPAALDADTLVVVEGEVDAMTIWQTMGGKVPVVAILACANYHKTLGARLTKDLRGKRFVIMLDADAAGKESAEKLRDGLIQCRVPAVTRYLYDYLPSEYKKNPRAVKIDANEILTNYGESRLQEMMKRAMATVKADLDRVAAQIQADMDAAGLETATPNLKLIHSRQKNKAGTTPTPRYRNSNHDDNDDDRNIIRDALQYIPLADADKVTRDDWFTIGCVMKRYGFEFEDFDTWSQSDPARYDADACRRQWDNMWTAEQAGEGGYAIGTLIKIAKEFGFNPPPREKFTSEAEVFPEKTQSAPVDPVDAALADWQKRNGTIEQSKLLGIKNALALVQGLTAANITADIAESDKTIHALALCAFYGFEPAATKFFAELKTAKGDADDSSPLKSVDVKNLRGRVAKATKNYQNQHEKYQRQCEAQRAADRREAELDKYHRGAYTTRKVVSDCPVDLILHHEALFDVDNVGVKIFSCSTGFDRIFPGACTPIVPTRRYHDPTDDTIRYEVAIKVNGAWKRVDFDADALQDSRRVIELAKYGACIRSAKYLTEYFALIIHANEATIPEVKAFKQTGWVDDDFNEFALPTADCFVRRAGYDFDKVFKPKGDADTWKGKFREVMEHGGAAARVAMGTAAASFLVRPLGLINLQLHIWGQRSIGKTPLEKFCAAAFGDPNLNALSYSFGATSPKSRLELHSAYRDLPLIGEEIEGLNKKDADHLPQEIYNFSLGISGQVLKTTGTLRDVKIFSGARLTSGEHDICNAAGNGGELKRVLSLRCATLLLEQFAADLHGFCKRHHGHFLQAWTQYIIKNKDCIAEKYHRDLKYAQQRFNQVDPTQLQTLTAALTAYHFFKACLNLSDLERDADAIDAEMTADMDAIVATLPTAADIDDTSRAIEFLKSFVAGHVKFFERDVKNANGVISPINACAIESYGKIFTDGEVAFLPHALKKILEGEGGFKSADKLIAEFYDRGLLKANKGERTFRTYIGDARPRTFCFKRDVFDVKAIEDTPADVYDDSWSEL